MMMLLLEIVGLLRQGKASSFHLVENVKGLRQKTLLKIRSVVPCQQIAIPLLRRHAMSRPVDCFSLACRARVEAS